LEQLASAGNVVVAVGYHTRHSGACRVLKYAIASGHFGRAVRFAHQDGGRGGWSPMSGYNLDTNRAGGGVLVTTGTHFLDRLTWLWGAPAKVGFRDNSMGGPESHCIARFEFVHESDSVTGSAVFSKVVSLPESTVVQTTDGLLIMPSDAAETITFRPRRDPMLEYEVRLPGHEPDPRTLYQRQLEDFILACRRVTKPCVDAAAGVRSVELLARLYAAREPLAVRTDVDVAEQIDA
jgi:predicted dehydrogenase